MYDWYPMNVGPGTCFPSEPGHNEQILGTCSICSGPVCCPLFYWSVVPPVPKCKRCGATKKESYGPVIDMVPQNDKVVQWPSTSTDYEQPWTKCALTGKWKDEYGNEWGPASEAVTNQGTAESALELAKAVTKHKIEALEKELDTLREPCVYPEGRQRKPKEDRFFEPK